MAPACCLSAMGRRNIQVENEKKTKDENTTEALTYVTSHMGL